MRLGLDLDRGLELAEAILHDRRRQEEKEYGVATLETLHAIEAVDEARQETRS